MMYCPICGTQNADTSRFCIKCGSALLNSTEVVQLPAPVRGTPPPPRPAPERRKFVWLGLGALAIIAVVAVVVINTTPASGRIAYHSFACDLEGGFDVYAMNSDGSKRDKLINRHFDGLFSAVSPDGRKILFISGGAAPPGGSVIDGPHVALAHTDKSSEVNLGPYVGNWNRAPGDWSFDGARIAFAALGNEPHPDTCSGICNSDIFVANADGSGILNLTNDPAIELLPSWAPDDRRIAFVRRSGDNPSKAIWEIYTIDIGGSDLTRLFHDESGSPVYEVVWSPNGRQVTFVLGGVVYVMNTAGSGQTKLPVIGQVASDSGIQWSPDSQWILISTVPTASTREYQILRIHPDGSGLEQLANGALPVWSLDGKKIAFTSLRLPDNKPGLESSDIYVMNADGSGITQLTNSPECELTSRWIP